MPTTFPEVRNVRQKDRSDAMAFVLVVLIFVAVGATIVAIGTGLQLPF